MIQRIAYRITKIRVVEILCIGLLKRSTAKFELKSEEGLFDGLSRRGSYQVLLASMLSLSLKTQCFIRTRGSRSGHGKQHSV